MKTLEMKNSDSPVYQRFSRRVVNGVEILEHEKHQVIRMNNGRYESVGASSRPQVVISDAPVLVRLFISKTRSEIAGLNSLLRSLTRPLGSE